MHPSEIESPESAPSPAPAPLSSGDDGWDSADWGPPGISSTTKLAVASYYVTSFAVILVVLY